jgi:ABC-2 type transport system ATP-binding protein
MSEAAIDYEVAPATDVICVEGASKRFGAVTALDSVTLRIARGQLVAVLGPNGAGKTTLLNLMLGLRRPTTGEVTVLGLSPGSWKARSECGVMLQESGVPGSLTVREVIDVFRSYWPAPLPTAEVLESAGLEQEAGKLAVRLSGGQKQRLYYALAICGNPQLLFLDEPTVGMDVESRRRLHESVRTMVEAGKTFVLTTHYLNEADTLADRVVILDHGRVIADGTPAAIKAVVPHKRIRLTADRVLTAELLSGLPGEVASVGGVEAVILTSQPGEVLRLLYARGVRVSDLEVGGADLEEAFLQLTKRVEDG